MKLTHISAVVVIFLNIFFIGSAVSDFLCTHVDINVTSSLLFSTTQTLLFENYCLNITKVKKYGTLTICGQANL